MANRKWWTAQPAHTSNCKSFNDVKEIHDLVNKKMTYRRYVHNCAMLLVCHAMSGREGGQEEKSRRNPPHTETNINILNFSTLLHVPITLSLSLTHTAVCLPTNCIRLSVAGRDSWRFTCHFFLLFNEISSYQFI